MILLSEISNPIINIEHLLFILSRKFLKLIISDIKFNYDNFPLNSNRINEVLK